MSHCVGDGAANNEIFRVLSEEIKAAQYDSNQETSIVQADMGLDRDIIHNMRSELPFSFIENPGYMNSTSIQSPELKSFQATTPEVPVLINLSPETLKKLKSDASTPDSPLISTHDALAALIWRSALLIRSRRASMSQEVLDSTTVDLFFPSDARRHLNIPDSYIGNVVYQLKVSLPLSTLLSPIGLQAAAKAIRATITAFEPELVKSYMAQMRGGLD